MCNRHLNRAWRLIAATPELTPGAKLALVYYADRTNAKTGELAVTTEKAIDATGLGRATLQRADAELVGRGWLQKTRTVDRGTRRADRRALSLFPQVKPGAQNDAQASDALGLILRPQNEPHYKDNPTSYPKDSDGADEQGQRERQRKPTPFDVFWQAYPTHLNPNPARAAAEFRKLSPDEQQDAIVAAPLYRQQIARNKTERRFVKHAHNFLSDRMFEAFATQAARKQASGARMSDDDYDHHVGRVARGQAWLLLNEPEPGKPGCRAPAHIQCKHGFTPQLPEIHNFGSSETPAADSARHALTPETPTAGYA